MNAVKRNISTSYTEPKPRTLVSGVSYLGGNFAQCVEILHSVLHGFILHRFIRSDHVCTLSDLVVSYQMVSYQMVSD